ncbi:putative chitinase [Pseudoxanthomonas winnipegensis]|uniref:Chitinase n=2 Tax=Pseudoxanthomonas TaxID=83618 RepID=A0AAW8G6N6_9GAMM|nr:peptidoglycan-binding protein [Pseudoxanthomonas winnipegensis]MDQ1117800.1 putative chitinase [Pseudoxanthomonas winnipegensis]MDQ1134769.1 putative chitinase [Pseudoxanthomonas winnipegensis]
MPDHKITRLVSSQGTTRTLELDDGSIVERHGGTVSWRNNNPGNLKFEFSGSADTTVKNPRTRAQALEAAQGRYRGVVDLDQWGNAVFESYEAGRAAKIQLLTRSHVNHTVEELLPSYSRPDYSGTTHYKEQAATIFDEARRHGLHLEGKTVGQMNTAEREALADGIRRFEGWRAGEVQVIRQPTGTPNPPHHDTQAATTAPSARVETRSDAGNAAILEAAQRHFFNEGRRYEYGRSDHPRPGRDPSRLERDGDGDGKLGVDCSSFVWRSLKEAGYGVQGQNAANFTTATLFNGNKTTEYAREHFDVISAADARKPGGDLKPGDLLMFSASGGQHIAVFKGYDAKGQIQFVGSQGSTGPAEVTIRPGGYWDGGSTHIVGALRAKPEFRVAAPTHGVAASSHPTEPTKQNQQSTRHDDHAPLLQRGDHGPNVRALQQQLNTLGVRDEHGRRLAEDGKFGTHTQAAVERLQRTHGIAVDGEVGPDTRRALAARPAIATPGLDQASHPDHRLYTAIRAQVPAPYSNELAAHITVQAKQHGIDTPEKVGGVAVQDGKAFVVGTTPGFRATVDLAQPPSFEHSSQQLLAQQRAAPVVEPAPVVAMQR